MQSEQVETYLPTQRSSLSGTISILHPVAIERSLIDVLNLVARLLRAHIKVGHA